MRFGYRAFVVLLSLSWTAPTLGTEILTYLPQNTLGFALVRDAQKTNDKIAAFVEIFERGVPGPLDLAMAVTGLASGLDVQGDALFALLPAAEAGALPTPMFLLPVTDYTLIAESITADTTGEICRVTIANEDVLVAQHGKFALLMNVEHRALMQQLLTTERVIPPAIATNQQWIIDNDVVTLVTSAGIMYLKQMAQAEHHSPQSEHLADPFSEPPLATRMLQIGRSLPLADLVAHEVTLAGAGVAIDDDINARFRWLVKFQEPRPEAATPKSAEKPFLGFAEKPYAVAATGSLPAEFATTVPELFTALARKTAAQDGRADFTDEDWADERTTHELWVQGLKNVSLLLTPGKEGEPMLSILFARLSVDDSQAYLEALKQLFALSNKLDARTKSDIKFNFQVAPVTIAEAEGFEATCDFDLATGDGNNIPWQAFLTSLLGVDHKLSLYFCASDEHQIFFAMESQEKLSAFIEAYRNQDTGLMTTTPVKTTIELLGAEAPWTGLVNPQGIVELVHTALKSVQILGMAIEFPPYPPAPPLGIVFDGQQTHWQGEMVMPVEAARAMAKFSDDLQAAFR